MNEQAESQGEKIIPGKPRHTPVGRARLEAIVTGEAGTDTQATDKALKKNFPGNWPLQQNRTRQG